MAHLFKPFCRMLKCIVWLFLLFIPIVFFSCNTVIEDGVRKNDLKKDIEFCTEYGSIIVRLSDETPKHRNNFIKLVNRHFYDSLLFHRVINNFVIQTGDPDSKTAKRGQSLGESDLPYTIPAEFNPNLFHKRGALNAARDDNPKRASSSTQFTFIQGKVYTDSMLTIAEKRINNWLAYNRVIHFPENIKMIVRLNELRKLQTNTDSIQIISDLLKGLTEKELENSNPYIIPEKHRQVYKTIGGAPHLDQNYTVFGEVIHGLDVIDSIAKVQTDSLDRPVDDVRIISARMIKRKNYN